jgi:hypothetical protein
MLLTRQQKRKGKAAFAANPRFVWVLSMGKYRLIFFQLSYEYSVWYRPRNVLRYVYHEKRKSNTPDSIDSHFDQSGLA